MGIEQQQLHCRCCQRNTLHSKTTIEPNHIVHLLAFLFLCGCWGPIWALIAIDAASRNARMPYRCGICGHAYGQPTAAEAQAIAEQRADLALRAVEKAGSFLGETLRMLVEVSAWLLSRLRGSLIAVARSIPSWPRRIDDSLARLAGDGNTIVHGFLRCLFIVGFVTAFSLVAYFAMYELKPPLPQAVGRGTQPAMPAPNQQAATATTEPNRVPRSSPTVRFERLGSHGTMVFAWLDPAHINDESAIKSAAAVLDDHKNRVGGVLFWTDRGKVPVHNWPMTTEQSSAEAVRFWRNDNNGQKWITWPDGREVKWK